MRHFRVQLLFILLIFISTTCCFYLNNEPTTETYEGNMLVSPNQLRCGPEQVPDFKSKKCRNLIKF